MNKIRNVKNIMLTLAFVSTMCCVAVTPNMVKWFVAGYFLYLVALGAGGGED